MAPRDAVAWDFDAFMPALRDPDRRIPLLKEVEKWSSTHADTILEVAARGQIEKNVDTDDGCLAPDGADPSSPPSPVLPGSVG